MILLLSGEGVTDLGACNLSLKECSNSEGGHFTYGVLTYLIDKIFESEKGYSLRKTPNSIHYRYKSLLACKTKGQSGGRELGRMRGTKKKPEIGIFYNNARALGLIALELQKETKKPVIAVLFKDSDDKTGTSSNNWDEKHKSIVDGFASVDFKTGVPMVAKPISEAWLLAACKQRPYEHCHLLENESGSRNAKKPLKLQLAEILGNDANSQDLIDWFQTIDYDYKKVADQMSSFGAFYKSFLAALDTCENTRY